MNNGDRSVNLLLLLKMQFDLDAITIREYSLSGRASSMLWARSKTFSPFILGISGPGSEVISLVLRVKYLNQKLQLNVIDIACENTSN